PELAALSGINSSRLRLIELDAAPIKYHQAIRLCGALGVELDDAFPAAGAFVAQYRGRPTDIRDLLLNTEAIELLLHAGIEADPTEYAVNVLLRGGASRFYPISIAARRRLTK